MPKDRRIVFTADARFAVSQAEGKPVTLTGYCMVWNALSSDRGGYKVRLLPGSATFTTPVLALFHHDFRHVIGNTDNGTLRLMRDDTGVKVEIDLPNTSTGRDVAELVGKGYVRGMSFAMTGAPDGDTTTENGQTILDAKSFEVDEVTVTPIPAFTETSIDVKQDPPAVAAARIEHSIRLARLRLGATRLPPAMVTA